MVESKKDQKSTVNAEITRHLLSGDLMALSDLLNILGLTEKFTGDAILNGADPVIKSPHRLGEASAIAQLIIGAAGAAIWEERTGQSSDIAIDILDALHFLHPTHYVQQQGRSINVGAESVPVNDMFLCKDNRYLMLEAGPPYAKLLKGYLNFFDCGDNKESYAREVAKWNSDELETELAKIGVPACRAFTREEWLLHPQGKYLETIPVIEIEKIADGPKVPFSMEQVMAPLSGIKVLDFTHVLAGPRSARTLAEYGADVLHVTSPTYPDTFAQHLGVDVGKRCTYLDLREDEDRKRIHELASTTDVFTTTYRHSVNERFGLLPEQLAKISEKGIICMTANAYGHSGPWADRAGFDQNGQVASGFAAKEGGNEKPKFSPVFYLADLMTGYFAAAGMMAALLKRATEGGSYHVKLSLARSAMWVQELGYLDTTQQDGLPATDNYPPNLATFNSVYGEISNLKPPLKFSNINLPEATYLEPYGSSNPVWK